MAIVISPSSELGKELARWQQPNYNPNDAKNRYPKMMYKAHVRPDGINSCGEMNDGIFGGAPGAAEAWSKRCLLIVHSEQEERANLERGWRETQDEALALLEAKQENVSTAAAHRHWEDRNMSELARAEAKEADDATAEHVAEVPEKRLDKSRTKDKPKRGPAASNAA